jgi:quercetin dioxygenase-like cupin family protein
MMAEPVCQAWDDVPMEQMSPLITRQYVTGVHTTVARIGLRAGAVVARHSHANEQISQVLSGSCTF